MQCIHFLFFFYRETFKLLKWSTLNTRNHTHTLMRASNLDLANDHSKAFEMSLGRVRTEALRQLMLLVSASSSSSSLKSLWIWEFDGMIAVLKEQQPLRYVSTLETLYIVKGSGLETLQHWMGSLSSLIELVIYDCTGLTSLPEEICSLNKLKTLYFCDYPLLQERYNMKTGEDQAKIAHISDVQFKIDRYMFWKVESLFYAD